MYFADRLRIYAENIQPDETDSCENAANSAIVKDGKYKLPQLPKGKYKIQVFNQEGKAKPKSKDVDFNVEAVEYKQLKDKSGKPDHGNKGKITKRFRESLQTTNEY